MSAAADAASSAAAAPAAENGSSGTGGGDGQPVAHSSVVGAATEVLPWHTATLLPRSILDEPTPSAKDGVAAKVETLQRMWGCTVICEAGCLLKLPQVVMATAQNLFHRFFWRKSLNDKRVSKGLRQRQNLTIPTPPLGHSHRATPCPRPPPTHHHHHHHR